MMSLQETNPDQAAFFLGLQPPLFFNAVTALSKPPFETVRAAPAP